MSKSGFTTLNRWLGRKNKDKSMANGKLSKSSTNLSISSTNINETSQLEYNRITPLPAATTNAPFEQTFRITVLLPKDQLYVTRLGARVPLSKLLELVCDNKLLDKEKYEFRNPVDASQVYSCDLTIGAVGLSEIRLCHKTESYDNFNSDEIIKLHRTSVTRESLSSSEFSSRNSKHTTKTTSPYSSTNSLNSMDSSAVSCGRTAAKSSLTAQAKMSAPPRKKRAAPRPPSQIAIPEKSPLIMENEQLEESYKATQDSHLAIKQDFSISTPNLVSSTMLHSDINGNDCDGNLEDFNNDLSSGNGSLNSHGYSEDTVLYAQIQKKNALNLNRQDKTDLEECGQEKDSKIPEPSPRKKIVLVKKKPAAPPAPPPRNSIYQEDAVSNASTNLSSSNSAPSTPKDLNTSPRANLATQNPDNEENPALNNNTPTPVPRITTSTILLNATDLEHDLKEITNEGAEDYSKTKQNISKVTLNRTPTPEPRSLSCEPSEIEQSYETQMEEFQQHKAEEDCISKQADSGIGEPVPSPLPDSLPSEVSNLDVKSQFESSSDDDDMVKVYNFKLGKTLVKPVSETKTLEELTILNSGQEEIDSELSTPLSLTQVTNTPNNLTETSSWNFAIPISPPPNFADSKFIVNTPPKPKPDTPITPKIMERPVLDFEILKQDQERQEIKEIKEIQTEKSLQSPTTPLDSILHELNNIIQEKGVDSLMKKCQDPQEIEAAKPNTLSNFSIHVITQTTNNNNTKPKEVLNENAIEETQLTVTDFAKATSPLSSPSSSHEEEKLYRKRCSVSSLKQRKSVTRSDSFHSTIAPNESLSVNKRTFSQLSLDQMAGNLNSRRSSSELSIAESPSLQSLEVIKTILNSRKNSLANSSGEEDKEKEVYARRPSEEIKFASLELKTSKVFEQNGEIGKKQENDIEEDTKNAEIKEEKSKELPKIYRYSGPPSINFSTWSERPKSQVAIKNEGDYIFGGAKGANTFKKQTTTSAFVNKASAMAAKPAAIQRMGIPEKLYKVPVLVKPLQDVVIDKAPSTPKEIFKKPEISQLKPQVNGDIKLKESSHLIMQRPTVESVLRPQTQVIVNTSCLTLTRNQTRPPIESVLRPQSETIVNTSTLPRAHKQRFSTPAATCATSSSSSSSSSLTKHQQQENEQNYDKQTNVPGPQILRSSSTKRLENEKSSMPPPQPAPAPFGQNTLRRTGFKEKIMATEEQETQIDRTEPTKSSTLINGDLKISTNQKFSNSLTSAKLHLNLKKTNTSITTITTNHQGCRTAPPNYTSSTISSHPFICEKSAGIFKPLSAKIEPPTPPAMIIQLKPVTQMRIKERSTDPRDELLAAIRNFKKDDLKKA